MAVKAMKTMANDAVEQGHQHRPDSGHQLSKKPTSEQNRRKQVMFLL